MARGEDGPWLRSRPAIILEVVAPKPTNFEAAVPEQGMMRAGRAATTGASSTRCYGRAPLGGGWRDLPQRFGDHQAVKRRYYPGSNAARSTPFCRRSPGKPTSNGS